MGRILRDLTDPNTDHGLIAISTATPEKMTPEPQPHNEVSALRRRMKTFGPLYKAWERSEENDAVANERVRKRHGSLSKPEPKHILDPVPQSRYRVERPKERSPAESRGDGAMRLPSKFKPRADTKVCWYTRTQWGWPKD